MRSYILKLFLLICGMQWATAQSITVGPFRAGHCQGIAVDEQQGIIYYSFTTMLVKTDLAGNVLGSVTGLLGHLGCLTFNPEDGRVYGSLEYKNDEIGKGILQREGSAEQFANAWYIAIFDGAKITRENMDYTEEGVMSAVYLPTVTADYESQQGDLCHRYGCSGIDGVTFGPAFGRQDGKRYLTCAYGIYGDTLRTDNDYQVLLQYDITDWPARYEHPMTQKQLHHSGPNTPQGKYFVYTGNTTWGVQNLTYDATTCRWLMFVYPGKKSGFTNHSLYIIDGTVSPREEILRGMPEAETGNVLTLWPAGIIDPVNHIPGWESSLGATGSASLSDGTFYLIRSYGDPQGQWAERIRHRWTGTIPCPFEPIESSLSNQ